MGPCTFLVTALVTNTGEKKSVGSIINTAWTKNGIKGFYPGGTAIAFRQATNWASRQGFTDGALYICMKSVQLHSHYPCYIHVHMCALSQCCVIHAMCANVYDLVANHTISDEL